MASIYSKNNKIYISWYDFTQQKRLNRSLNLENTPKNMKEALTIKKKFEEQLAKEKEKIQGLVIKRRSIHDAFQHYLLNNSSKNPKTIKGYNYFYDRFKQSFDPDQSCLKITKLSAENWLNELKKLDLKRNTISTYYRHFSHFLGFLFEYNYIPMFKINRDVKPKVENVEKVVISLEDLALIFYMLDEFNMNDNFKFMLYFLYYTGLRATDALSIKIENIDVPNRTIKFFSPKRQVYRQVAFHEDLISHLNRLKSSKSKGSIIEYSNEGTLQRAIHRYLTNLELTQKSYSSRSFRKTFVTMARRNKMDETVVKELVGHAHSSTTDRFYNKIDMDQMKDELTKLIPVSKLPYDSIRERVKELKEKSKRIKS